MQDESREGFTLQIRMWLLKAKYENEEKEEDKLVMQDNEHVDYFNMLYGLRMAKNIKKYNQYNAQQEK